MNSKITAVVFKQVTYATMTKEDFLFEYGDDLTTEQKDQLWDKYIEELDYDITERNGDEVVVECDTDYDQNYEDCIGGFADPEEVKKEILNPEEA